jgi:hypothetical protein
MVDAIVVHGSTWIIDPVLGRLEVVGSPVPLAGNGGDFLRPCTEEGSLAIPAADEELGHTGGEGKEGKEEEGPSMGHGGQELKEIGAL